MSRLRSNPVRTATGAALAALVLVCLAAWPALAQEVGTDWSQFQGGPGHPGTIAEAPIPPYRELWRFSPPEGALSGAVISGDLTIAVGESAVYALELGTGEIAWELPRDGGRLSVPALGVTGERRVLVYLDGPREDEEGTGSSSPSPSTSPSSSVSPSGQPADQNAVKVSELVAVDLGDRSELWRTPLEDASRSGVALEGDRAYAADDEGRVYAVELATGAVAWSGKAIGRVESPPAVADGNVYVVARSADERTAQVLALDPETGERRWTFSPQAGAVAVSAVSAQDGVVVFGSADRLVRGSAAEDGKVRWEALTLTLFSPVSAPAFRPGGVWVADASGGLYRIDPADGGRDWEHQTNELVVRSSPVVAGAYVLLGLNDGRLVAFDDRNGDLVYESRASQGLIGQIALSREVVVAVKGGKQPGLIAFEHDPEGTLVRIVSPTVPDPARLFGAFAVAFAIAGVVILVPFRLLRSRFAPAFTRDDGLDDGEGAEEETS